MVQLGERGGFCPEPLHDVRVGQLRVEHLDRDLAIERLVDRLVNGAHAAAPKRSDDAVFPDGLANHEGSRSTRISAFKSPLSSIVSVTNPVCPSWQAVTPAAHHTIDP